VVWCSPAPGQLGPLAESMMREYQDIGFAHVVTTELSVARVKDGKKQWHFRCDG
jgi:hypothetical protein